MSLPGRLSVILRAALAVGVGFVYLSGSAVGQIPPGFEVIQITDDPDYDGPPAINNCGQIVFSKRINQGFDTEEIFLYDPQGGGQVIRITNDNVRDAFPDINDQGTIVWSRARAPGELENFEIAMWKDGQITMLTDNDVGDWGPRVNGINHVAWSQKSNQGCNGAEVLFHDGQGIQQITENGFSNQMPRINDLDEIAWTRYDFCTGPWRGTIMLFSGGTTIALSDGLDQDQGVDINDLPQVVWADQFAGILRWEDGATDQISLFGRRPRTNNRAEVSFQEWDDDLSAWQQWLWRDGKALQLTAGAVDNLTGSMNDCGEVAWKVGDFPLTNIWLLRHIPGDANSDDSINSTDFAAFVSCFTGPRVLPSACRSVTIDADADGDVDLRDFAILQNDLIDLEKFGEFAGCFSGPTLPADRCVCRTMDLDHDDDVDLRDFMLFQTVFGGPG